MFDPAIPQPTDVLSDSQSDLLTNFGQLNTQFSVNHVAFDDGSSDKGKHKFVTFVEQAAAPTTIGDEYALYALDSNGQPELYAQPERSTSGYQITKEGILYLGITPAAAVNFNNAGTIQGSALNVSSVSKPGATARFVINFTTPMPNNSYFWSISGFGPTSTETVYGQPTNDPTYGNSVKTTSLSVDFKNRSGSVISTITRGVVIIWRFQ